MHLNTGRAVDMSVQKRIRDLMRLLRKKGDDPEAVATLEAKISDLRKEKTDNAMKERERKNSVKYHMVKFFERRKLTRKIRSIDSKLKVCESSKEKKKLNKEREKVKENLAYVLYYPKSLKYIALFAESNAPEDSDEGEDTGKTSIQLSRKARVLALAAWKESIADEKQVDKVEDAIAVEYEKPLKGASFRKHEADNKVKDGIGSDAGCDDDQEGSDSSGSVSSSESEETASDSDAEDDTPMMTSSKKASKRQREEWGAEQVSKKPKKPVIAELPKSSIKPKSSGEFVPDAFFAEEADDAENIDGPVQPAWSGRDGRGRGRSMRGGRGGRGGSFSSRGSRGLSSSDSLFAPSDLTKQESRLLSWQSGLRGRGRKNAGRSTVAGRGAESEGVRPAQSPSVRNKPLMNAGRGRGSKIDNRKDTRGRAPIGGAGRAQHNGVAQRQAVIIGEQPQNKKIVFDEN